MAYVTWSLETLERFCKDVFTTFGFSVEESAQISDVLLTADLFGIESHGMQRMVRYHKGIEKGQIHLDAQPEVVFETPISATIDGHSAMGQLVSVFAMKKAIEKAKTCGIGIVTVRESNHYGIAGYYAKMASDQGLIGFSCTNSEAIMVPTFARQAMIGSNPIAVAVPADPVPFLFDASTTVVTRGKLEMYNKMGKPLPEGWALDENGVPCSEAPRVLSNIVGKNGGGIMPLGGSSETLGSHKGYGWGMVAELFSSILSQGVTSNECCTFEGRTGICHGFAAIDPAAFGDPDAIREHFSEYLKELRCAPLADGATRIYTHGEKEVLAQEHRRKNGVPVNDGTMVELLDLCDYLKLDFASYFPGYEPPAEFAGFAGNY
ncbi:Uncharacterized oxidoreductase ybiC [Slackia heliotrinireducens]|uniref:Malate dehydrogenase (NAD) n=1 Tax=Slackia heliotrinireducens (strain ATCC 29202 / DSM 20476 / NCTC 11029 / RHS 1) TaxID=471855 RepID=C7N716_SLAHD|nr:Ldh family oxidoreductase [Slackia heliotrinireducens]ACV22701.1 malate dehydrogenase (NAD) [Slackia heliotrinireducens DSM 20476]VEH01308.1 Uncharacterized oxidoreductase ybiC [Slackia heliotrinireducens]